jgi:hypothetical protein
MSLSVSDIGDRLRGFDADGERGWYAWDWERSGMYHVPEVGAVEVVERVGGEGEGDHKHIVFRITPMWTSVTRYFKKNGYYSSYDGTDWDGAFFEVEPVRKTVTVYEEVSK